MAKPVDTTKPAAVCKCSAPKCEKQQYAGGMCAAHYREHLAQRRGNCAVDGCNELARVKDLCNRHYARFRRHGSPYTPGKSRPGEKEKYLRELPRNGPKSDCVRWPFPADDTGYAGLNVAGKKTRAHRFVCELANGPPPGSDSEAAHNCGNAWCVNPDHLRWDTAKGNAEDRERHGTALRGEDMVRAKLTNSQAMSAYQDKRPCRDIALEYGVTPEAIGNLKAGRTWAWLTGHKR